MSDGAGVHREKQSDSSICICKDGGDVMRRNVKDDLIKSVMESIFLSFLAISMRVWATMIVILPWQKKEQAVKN